MTKRYFTLLEVMVGCALLILAVGAIGWKMHTFLEKRRFSADLEQLASRIHTLHYLAVNMQADWKGVLFRRGGKWSFETRCIEQTVSRSLPALSLHPFSLFVDGKEQGGIAIEFFSSGEIRPCAHLLFRQGRQFKEWKLPEIFQKEEGDGTKKLGPIHPDDFP